MAACDLALEFVETTLHSLLYLRKLYPEGIFRKRQKYKVPAYMSVHHGVNKYIANTLRALRPYVEQQLLEEIAFIVTDPAGRTFETITLELSVLDAVAFTAEDDLYLTQLEAKLAGALVTLYAALSEHPPPPDDSTFRLYATVSRCLPETLERLDAEFPLVVADTPPEESRSGLVVPLRSVRGQLFSVQMALRRPAAQPAS